MDIVNAQQMAEIDRRTSAEFGLDSQVLMENAGRRVAAELSGRVAFLVGPGNNGGDGLVAARSLLDRGGRPEVFLLKENLSGDAQRNLERARRWGVPIRPWPEQPPDWSGYDQVVDSLFGTGLKRNLEASLIEWLRDLPEERCLAVDIPSGIHTDTGQILGGAVRARRTLTFGLPRLGQLLQPGAAYCGELQVVDIGFPRALLQGPGRLLDAAQVAACLPRRDYRSHKRNLGKLLIVAGSERYPGAAALCVLGALRSGAGLVYVLAPARVLDRLAALAPEAIPLETRREAFSEADLEKIRAESVDALAIGPGLGDQPATLQAVRALLEGWPEPAVIDADALKGLPAQLSPRMLLTPHAGELARLLHVKPAEIERERLSTAVRAARNHGCTLLSKGDPTLVASAGGGYLVSREGTAVLAQGGSGDVLSGIAGALLAQGLPALEAGGCAAFLQGRAGRLARVPAGLGARALAEHVPAALESLTEENAVAPRAGAGAG